MSTKILIHQDESAIERTIKCIETFTPELNTLKEKFEKFTKEQFSDEVFKVLIEDKGENIIQKYLNSVNKELDKIGIINEVTREGLIKSHEEVITQFRNSIKSILQNNHNEFGIVRLEYVSFKKSRFIISDESMNLIKEKNSIYLETKEEIELYNQLKDTFSTIEKAKEKIEKAIGYKLPEHLKTIDIINTNFIKEYGGKLIFTPKDIKMFINTYKH